MPPERPDDWSVAAPWAMLDEFALNLEFIEETHYQDATSIHTTATLTLKTYPGPAFRLKLSAHEAMSIATAVQEASTFVWDDLDVVSIPLPNTPTYPLPYRPVVMSLGEQLKKRGL